MNFRVCQTENTPRTILLYKIVSPGHYFAQTFKYRHNVTKVSFFFVFFYLYTFACAYLYISFCVSWLSWRSHKYDFSVLVQKSCMFSVSLPYLPVFVFHLVVTSVADTRHTSLFNFETNLQNMADTLMVLKSIGQGS